MGSTKPPNMAKTPRPEKRSREEDTSGLDTQSRPAKYRRTERLQESNNSNTTGHPKPNNVDTSSTETPLSCSTTGETVAEKAFKKIHHIEYIDETSDSGSEADSESSDSSSEVSETESEMAALEAADKKKYITFERGGFGPFRGPDGKFSEYSPPKFLCMELQEIPEATPAYSDTDSEADTSTLPSGSSSEDESQDLSENHPEPSPESTPLPEIEETPTVPTSNKGKKSKKITYGDLVSEAELERIIEEVPDKDDPCFQQKTDKTYLPRHASYTPLIYDLETIGYTRDQIIWLFGAHPEPMTRNTIWMRMNRYKKELKEKSGLEVATESSKKISQKRKRESRKYDKSPGPSTEKEL